MGRDGMAEEDFGRGCGWIEWDGMGWRLGGFLGDGEGRGDEEGVGCGVVEGERARG